MYVVRAALDPRSPAQEPASLFRGLQDAMDRLEVDRGSRSVEVKGRKLWYKTLQMTDDVCTCKYVYEGNVKIISSRCRVSLRCLSSSKAFMERAMRSQGITFSRLSAIITTTERTRKSLGTQINPICYRPIQTSSRCHSDVAACSVTCLTRRRSHLSFTGVSSLEVNGRSGGRRLLMVVYAVAGRCSLVMSG